MAHHFDTGFCVRQASWHQLENLLDDYPEDWDAARLAAGLMWEPTYRDLYVPETFPLNAELPAGAIVVSTDELTQSMVAHVPAGGHQAIVRDDTGAVLATPKDSYKLITHAEMGGLLEAYTDAWRKTGSKVQFETAGSVMGGARVWALVRLDEPYTVPGDSSETYPYAVMTNAHDGSAACRLTETQVRVVCANTWKRADLDADARGTGVVLRHAGNMADRMDDAKASLAQMRDGAKSWQMLATDLAGLNYDDQALRHFTDEFIPVPEGASDRTRNARADKQAVFHKILASDTCAELPDTAYKLVQGAGEYLDHFRPYRSADTYLARTLLRPETIKGGVVKLAREVCSA